MPFRPKLVVEVRHGLGNRLRAYLAAAEVAARSGRALTLVWTPDAHCNATFDALFARPPGLCVRTALPPTEAGAAAPLTFLTQKDAFLRPFSPFFM